MKFNLEFPDKLIEEIKHEGPELARMNMNAFLETEGVIFFSRLFHLEGFDALPTQKLRKLIEKWKQEEDDAIAMFEGTHLQTKELSVHNWRKLLSKHLQKLLEESKE